MEHCKLLFGDYIAVFSNSAGGKKPGGNADEIEKNFGCESSKLIMTWSPGDTD